MAGTSQGLTGHVAPDLTRDPTTFVAHVEGPRDVVDRATHPFETVEAAVAWAVARAPTVLVRGRHDTIRWAGEAPPPAEPDMPRWQGG